MKRSLVVLIPLSRNEQTKKTIQKTKRCDTQHRKNRFVLLSTKEDSKKIKITDKNINVGISKQNLDDHILRNTKYSQEKSAASKRMIAETHEDEMLLRALKNNLNAKDVIVSSKAQEKAKKCNTDKYICHCKEENFSSSSKKSSAGSSSITGTPERTNHQLTEPEVNTKSDILQQKSPIYHKSPLLNTYFPIPSYPEKMNIPSGPILYRIMPNVSPYMVGKERKYINVEIPITSFDSSSNYLIGNNQYPISHQKPCICSPERHQEVESSIATSPSTNYVDAIIRETTNDPESNELIGEIGEGQEHPKLITEDFSNEDSETDSETILHLNDLTDITEESNISPFNLNEVTLKSEDFTDQTEKNPGNNLSTLTTYSTDNAGISSAPFFTNDEKLINMEECIQLFGRDVCVLSATSSKMLAKQAQENNLTSNKYSTIRIPEYITQISARKETTLNSIDYTNKPKTTDPYFASKLSTSEINVHKSNQYPESTEQIFKSDIKNKVLNTLKYIPMKKLDPTIDEIAKTERNKLGKSKSHTNKLLFHPNPNDEELTISEKFFYSTPSYKSSRNEEVNNLKINQQNRVININSESNPSPKEETTVISYDSKTEYDSKEQNRNYLKESNTDIYEKERKTPQEYFKEDTATTSSNSKMRHNFEDSKKEIEVIVHPEQLPEAQSTTMKYLNDKKSSNLNYKKNINSLEAPIDSSTSRLPFCDNTLLLNSIRKIINDFALDARLTKPKDFDGNVLQTQGKNLLPEILQVPNLKNILSVPQIENTIVERVKDVLSHVTAIPRKDFTNDWSHGVIKNTLHSILDTLSDFQHKHSPIRFEEHQFSKNGQWKTNLVTLAPISDQKLSKEIPENLRENIKDLLRSPAIRSQTDQHIVRNMIIQTVKNDLINDDKMDNSIIHALNDVLQTLKNSKDINTLGKSNKVMNDEGNTDKSFSQEITSETGININNLTLSNKQKNLDEVKEDTKMDSKKIQITDYQKATSEFPHLLQLAEEQKKTTDKSIVKIEKNIKDQIVDKIKKTVQDNATKNIGEEVKHILNEKLQLTSSTEIDPLIILERIKCNLPPTKYYSPEILKYATNHRIDDKNVEITTASSNFIHETSSKARMLDGVISQNTDIKNDKEIKYPLTSSNLISPTNAEYRDYKSKSIPLTDKNILESQQNSQQKNFTDDIIKIHEVTTEVQRTYAKTTYFKTGPSSDPARNPSSSPLISTDVCNNDKENDNYNSGNDLIDNKINNNAMKAKEVIVSSSKSFARDDIDPPQLFPSLIAPNNDISELRKSQLYYISDGVKLPLEIKKLEDGFYALLISKNICEQILTGKCPCCVPLQGYVVRAKNQQEDMHTMTSTRHYSVKKKDHENICIDNIERDYQPIQPFNTIVTRSNSLKTEKSKEEKEKINTDYLSKQNDDDLAIISMPVIDFAKKYNLLLDFNEEKILFNEAGLQNKIQNYDKSLSFSLLKSEKVSEYDHTHTQSEEKNLNNYPDIKKNRLNGNNDAIDKYEDSINIREKKNTPRADINSSRSPIIQKFFDLVKNFGEFVIQKANATINQSEIDQGLKLRQTKTANDIQNMVEKMNFEDQEKIHSNPRAKINKEEMKSDKLSSIAEGNYYYIVPNKNFSQRFSTKITLF